MSDLTLDSVVAAAPDTVSQELSGEALVLSLSRAEYFGLNDTGTFIWQALAEPVSVREIARKLTQAFDVAPADADRDALELIGQLHAANLVTIRS